MDSNSKLAQRVSFSFALATAIAFGALTAPAAQVGAQSLTAGWSCQGTDSCHEGEAACCGHLLGVPVGQGRCTTMCSPSDQ